MATSHSAGVGRTERFSRALDVQLADLDDGRPLGAPTRTIDVSRRGLLVEVPDRLHAVCGAQVRVHLRWSRREFQTNAEVVWIVNPCWQGRRSMVMGLRLRDALPSELLDPPPTQDQGCSA